MEYPNTVAGLQRYLINLIDECRKSGKFRLKVYTCNCPFIGGDNLSSTYSDPYRNIIKTILRYYSQQGIDISITFMNDDNVLIPKNWYYSIKIKQLYER
jgi:hypothetical protein